MRSMFLCPVPVAAAGAPVTERGSGATAPVTPGAATLRDYRASGPRLYAALAHGVEGNFVMSFRALHTALGMAYVGANAFSRDAMAKALHWSSSPEALVAGHREATDALYIRLARAGIVFMNEASRLWVRSDYTLTPSFQERLTQGYRVDAASLDLAHAAQAAETINAWVKGQTAGMIGRLVESTMLSPATRLVQTSALHVKAGWADGELSREEAPRPFTTLHGKAQSVHMLVSEAGLAYEDDGLVAVSLDYERDRLEGGLAMTFFLPKGPLADLEAHLAVDPLARINVASPLLAVEAIFPSFTVAAGGEATDALKRLGIERIVLDRISQEELEVATVVQQSRLKVDEKGTEGASAVAVVMAPTGAVRQRRQVVLDRPFLFVMHDKITNEVLFMGRVTHL